MEIIVFTNGCYDIIHPGHIDLLKKARRLGTRLIVGINSDNSVRAIKGYPRPFLTEQARAAILKELKMVDEVYIFDENTPERLIRELKPDVLVKGGDWQIEQIVGADFVLKNGGQVLSIPFTEDFSSSKIVEKIISTAENPTEEKSQPLDEISVVNALLRKQSKIFTDYLETNSTNISHGGEMILETIKQGKKVFLLADVEHSFNAYLVKTLTERLGGEGSEDQFISLTSAFNDSDDLTAVELNHRSVSGELDNFREAGDLLLVISDQKTSDNLLNMIMKAREHGIRTIALTSILERKLAALCDFSVLVNQNDSLWIQSTHLFIAQFWNEILKNGLKK